MNAEALKTSEDRPMRLWLAVAIVLLAIAAALGPVAVGGFSFWDDEDTIALNPSFNPPTWASLAQRWTWPHLHIYIPLTHTVWHTLAVISPKPPPGEIGNLIALPFKLASLGAHAITSVLVLLILRRLVGPRWPALVGAIAFAVHPVQVETVAWASGLKDVMFVMFSAACVLAYVGGDSDRLRPRGQNVLIAIAMLVLAALSKPTAMVVPAMLFVLDIFWLKRPTAQSIARLMPFAVVAGVFAWIAWILQPAVPHETQVPFAWRPLVAVDAIAFYARKLILPVDLAYDYGRTAQSVVNAAREQPWRAIVMVTAVIIGGIGVIVARRRLPLVAVGVVLALIGIAPVLGFTHFDFAHYSTVADHYMYLPMLGIAIAIAGMLDSVRSGRKVVFGVVGLVAVVWIVLSFRQSLTWRDARSVTAQTLEVNDNSYASWSNLAIAELRAGDVDAAELHARRAIELSPGDPQSMFVMANVLQERGDDRAAADLVRQAVKLSPYSAAYHHRLAVLLGKQGEFAEALEELDRTLALDHNYPGAEAMAAQLRAFMWQRASTMRASAPAK